MVWVAIFRVFEALLIGLFSVMPTLPLPAWWSSDLYVVDTFTLGNGFRMVGQVLATVNGWMPAKEALDIVPIVLQFTLALLGFRVLLKAYSLIRGGGD